ncbi:hypothetical protein J0S82_007678 [Galemys pyrenaicus]|uniref:Uncharacterized protein n=1 Tax=Galemys pyrenaicus TaxID=202257 RepID=A0A8J6DIF9_GALPY|nr:hypothetical protein J0S82_007678 [Galemys pyrenaicus]
MAEEQRENEPQFKLLDRRTPLWTFDGCLAVFLPESLTSYVGMAASQSNVLRGLLTCSHSPRMCTGWSMACITTDYKKSLLSITVKA